jgi:hypothetical protein
MVARGLTSRVVTVVCVVAGGLLFATGSASAAVTYPFDGQFSGGASGNGVAVNDFNGDIYMVEPQTDVVEVLDGSGAPVQASIDGSSTPAGSFGGGNERLEVAANNGTGDVYVLDTAHGVIDEFDSSGSYLCQITGGSTPSPSECNGPAGSETPDHGFGGLRDIAVNQSNGDVYVVDTEHGVVDIFSATGAYQSQIALSVVPESFPEGFKFTSGLAVDGSNGRVYVDDLFRSSIYEFNASGEYVTTLTGANTPAGTIGESVESTIAVDDPTGDLYVTDPQHDVTDAFDASGAYLTQFGHSYNNPLGTAVDQATGRVYVSDVGSVSAPPFVDVFGPGLTVPDVHTGSATEIEPTSVTLNGTVDPDGLQISDCHFDYGTDTSYGQTAPCVPSAGSIPSDSSEHAVSAHLTGLQPGITYHFRLDASNANSTEGPNTGVDETLSTPPQPSIENEAATNVARDSADITASIDPKGFATTYHFEWGTTIAYGNRVPLQPGQDEEISAGTTAKTVTAHLTGLEKNKEIITYHWRVLATNRNGTTVSSDHTFVYDTTGGGLPDKRAYEMVTPIQKNAAVIGLGVLIAPFDISEDGSRVTGESIQCFAGAESCTALRQLEGEPYLFTRTSRGWATTALAPPTSFGNNTSWEDNANTGTALFSMATPPTNEDDWFTRGTDGKLVDVGPTTPPADGQRGVGDFSGNVLRSTPDFSHIVWESAPIWPFDENIGSKSLYEYAGQGVAPTLVAVSGGLGSHSQISMCGLQFGGHSNRTSGFLSLDGRFVYFTAEGHSKNSACPAELTAPEARFELYARIDQSQTVDVSQRSSLDCTSGTGCASSPPGAASFEDASADGSKVFFTDTQQLTDSAAEDSAESDSAAEAGCERTIGANGCNLYEYDFSSPKGENLLALSTGDMSGGGPRVQRVMAVSSDGSHVYFVAKSVLSAVVNDRGEVARNGAENMYVFERDGTYPHGHVAFITRLPDNDVTDSVPGSNQPYETSVTPDGRFIVFTSRGELTADDTGASDLQVFRYDAQTATLVRISVGNDGFNDDGNRPFDPACEEVCPEDAGIALNSSIERRDQTMSHDGSYVFFQSPVGLTPQALNDVQISTNEQREQSHPIYAQNVYEWHAGHVYLISDGRDTTTIGESGSSSVKLMGSDATGANVFFSTADSLVPQDTDTQLDYYDARVCTAGDPCVASASPLLPPCLGEACHGTPAATPVSPNVPTVTFNGQGNLIAPAVKSGKTVRKTVKCVKGKRRVRGKCTIKPKRRKAKAKKTVQRKRAGRLGSVSRKGGK